MNKLDNKDLIAKREENEARFAYARILELRRDPVKGLFDAAHLREVNRRIFQDLPKLGYDDVKPGQYRGPTEDGRDWLKTRRIETIDQPFTVAYSPMDTAAQNRIESVLLDAHPTTLGKLSLDEFSRKMGDLYTQLDYLHPFEDGNSRTLRTFTQQLAKEAGYVLEWDKFAQTSQGRDQLYIARDLSVNQIALDKVQDPSTQRDIFFTLDIFEGNKDLPTLIKEIVRPGRAQAFEFETESDALKQFPELQDAYTTLHAASKYFASKAPGNGAAQNAAEQKLKTHIQARLDKDQVTGFMKERSNAARASKPARPAVDKNDRER